MAGWRQANTGVRAAVARRDLPTALQTVAVRLSSLVSFAAREESPLPVTDAARPHSPVLTCVLCLTTSIRLTFAAA